MPIKFRQSEKVFKKDGPKIAPVKHYYMKQTPTAELIDYINKGQKNKVKQKCRNELTRRGVRLVWTANGS